jgi:hypothetical protein
MMQSGISVFRAISSRRIASYRADFSFAYTSDRERSAHCFSYTIV